MKRLAMLICTALFCLNGCTFHEETPVNPFRIQTSVTEFSDADTFCIQYHYDSQGMLHMEEQTVNGVWDRSITYEYDSWGNSVREFYRYSDNQESIAEHFLTLDDNHRVVCRENYYDTEMKDSHEIAYDKKGNQIAIISTLVQSGRDETIRSEMQYDRYNRLVKKEVQWQNDPSKGGTTTYCYEKDRLTREEFYAPAGWLKSYIEYSYDDSGLIQTANEYNGNGTLQSKTIITYDAYGNVLQNVYYRYTDKSPDSTDEVAYRITTCTYERIASVDS